MLSHIDIHKMNALMQQNEEAKIIIQQLLENHQTVVSTIAHEVRNPLTLINSSLQIMEIQHPEVKDFSNWKQTMEDVAFMCQLLEELSTFNNGNTLRYQIFSLHRLLKNAALSFAMSLEDSDIEFASSIDSDITDYAGDEHKLHEVFLNLLKNAKEAFSESASGTGTKNASSSKMIRLEAHRKHHGIEISVTDNGCGIDEEELSSIFKPFHTTKREGTGLGLSISQRIIEAHKGKLSVRSDVGKGSTFTVFLPF